MNTPHEPDMKRKFKELYVDYKLAVTAAYFSGAQPPSTSSTTTITASSIAEWEGSHDIKGFVRNPVLARLATPKLTPELQQHLDAKK